MIRKGIILAGGTGSRLYPMTHVVSKQLIPVYDKPMIYYALSVLMLANIREILIISGIEDIGKYQLLLKNGEQFGIEIQYVVQDAPNGVAEAYIYGERFVKNTHSTLILGDNLFWGSHLKDILVEANYQETGATIFAYHVQDPERYGVVEFDSYGRAISIEEKPNNPKSNYAVTGLYFYDPEVIDIVKSIKPSDRNELEITDVNQIYLKNNSLKVKKMGAGYAWLDTGTPESLLEASQFIHTLEKRQGLKILCPEEIAWKSQWISDEKLLQIAEQYKKNSYGQYLKSLLSI